MLMSFSAGNKSYSFDAGKYHNLTIAIRKGDNVNCYYLDDPAFSYFSNEQFTGSLKAGGSVNCEKISLYAHASGTHTECALHVLDVPFSMKDIDMPLLQLCRLVSIRPEERGGDKVIDENAFDALTNGEGATAVCIRTLPNEADKLHRHYAGTNPPYFTPAAVLKLKALGFRHLLTDLPSIDREEDEGKLAAHKDWFAENGVVTQQRTITEFIYAPENIPDGMYAVSIACPQIETDAVVSKVLLYPCV